MIYESSKLTFSGGTVNMMPVLYNFLSLFTDKFVLDEGWLIFNDSVKFRIDGNTAYPQPQVVCHDSNNTVVYLSNWGRWNRQSSTTAAYTTILISNNVFELIDKKPTEDWQVDKTFLKEYSIKHDIPMVVFGD